MKFIKIILFQFLFIGIFAGVVAAQTLDGSYTFSSATNQFSAGSEAVVTVTVSSQQMINAVQATVSYPSSKLTFERIDATGSPFEIDLNSSAGNGTVMLARGTTKPISGDNTLAKVYFMVKQPTNLNELTLINPSLIASSTTNKNIFSGVAYYKSGSTGSESVRQLALPPHYLPTSTTNSTPTTASQGSWISRFISYVLSIFHMQ